MNANLKLLKAVYKKNVRQQQIYLGTRRVTQYSSKSVSGCLCFVPARIGVEVNGVRSPQQTLLLAW